MSPLTKNHRTPLENLACLAAVALACSCWARSTAAESKPDHVFADGVEVYLLSAAEAAEAVLQDAPSPYFDRLTPLEISLRLGHELKSSDPAKEQANFKQVLKKSTQDWTKEEKDKMLAVLKSTHAKCQAVVPSLIPKKWRFIKTSHEAEPAPHTRGDCVVLPSQAFAFGLHEDLIIHETFHVYSRMNAKPREELYRSIGFRHLGKVTVPKSLEDVRITNPDGPDFGYAITLKNADGKEIQAVPMTYSKHDSLKPGMSNLFHYFAFGYFEVRKQGDSWGIVTDADGKANPLPSTQMDSLYEQIGQNTGYIIHPDEVLADNVTLLVRSESGDANARVRTPEILKKVKRIMNAP